MKKLVLGLLGIMLFNSTIFALERGDNGYYCYTYSYWWDKSKEASYVVIEDVSSSKYKVQFLQGVYNSTTGDHSKGDYVWVWKSDVRSYESDCK